MKTNWEIIRHLVNISKIGQQKLMMESGYTLLTCNSTFNSATQMFSILCETSEQFLCDPKV